MGKWLIEAEKITDFLEAVARDSLLVAPVREEEGIVLFRPVESAGNIDLDYLNSAVSPKEFFFPRTEKLFSFQVKGAEVAIEAPGKQRGMVMFGIRPCDLRGIMSLDPVFGGDFPDPYYQEKRKAATIIAMGCETPSPRCFCSTYGISPMDGSGSDIMLTRVGSHYQAEALTGKGDAMITRYGGFFVQRKEGQAPASMLDGKVERLDLTGIKEFLDGNFELPYWEEVAEKCINCGICTYICPTCHCFNIFDLTAGGTEGVRCRGWDSCMSQGFTRMAGGHNPRPGKLERVRNRFMHKLKYHLDRYGIAGCYGCGRCVGACPVNIDIRRIISDLGEVARNG
ncbi:MAG: 4Fe-4S dicluster domain-containing protein [Bacillota bacterium]